MLSFVSFTCLLILILPVSATAFSIVVYSSITGTTYVFLLMKLLLEESEVLLKSIFEIEYQFYKKNADNNVCKDDNSKWNSCYTILWISYIITISTIAIFNM